MSINIAFDTWLGFSCKYSWQGQAKIHTHTHVGDCFQSCNRVFKNSCWKFNYYLWLHFHVAVAKKRNFTQIHFIVKVFVSCARHCCLSTERKEKNDMENWNGKTSGKRNDHLSAKYLCVAIHFRLLFVVFLCRNC